MASDYANLHTPPLCVADFCLVPIGTATASVSNEVAAVQRLMKASGLSYSMHSAGTTVGQFSFDFEVRYCNLYTKSARSVFYSEGPWDKVMKLIGQAHTLVHQNGVLRVQTDIRIGTRTDKKQHFSEKVSKVESILAADNKPPKSVQKEAVTTETVATDAGPSQGQEAAQKPQSPVANKATWASMFKK